ncbi:alpha/beta fold hydrolase [Nocardia sp. CNY236]|uniref:alpha/beta fold hydrolase n=1 Tax=Nocardia sp. CNY236 TaxID=1169152 RepID=UPI00350F3A66
MFVHGLLANGDLWRHVAPVLASHGYRCLTPDWPLGSHTLAVPDQELTHPRWRGSSRSSSNDWTCETSLWWRTIPGARSPSW